jgi:DNA gyrase subunit A
MGVKTIQLTEKKGGLAGALIVREHFELVFISQSGMVQRTPVRGISSYGRASQGVKLMNIRDDDDRVSAVALVAESSADTEAKVDSGQDELEGEVIDGGGNGVAPAEAPDPPETDSEE